MKPRLYDSGKKMRMINQLLLKRRKLALKKLRIQEQRQQQPINITINNTGFETNQRIKDIYKRLELITPQEKITKPQAPSPPPPPPVKVAQEQRIFNPDSKTWILKELPMGVEVEKKWGRGEFKDKSGKVLKLSQEFMKDKTTAKKKLGQLKKGLLKKYFE